MWKGAWAVVSSGSGKAAKSKPKMAMKIGLDSEKHKELWKDQICISERSLQVRDSGLVEFKLETRSDRRVTYKGLQ